MPFRAVPLRKMLRPVLGICLLAALLALVWKTEPLPILSPPLDHLEQVKKRQVLRVASVYGRTTCYTGPGGLVGYECELAQGLARHLGVTAEVSFSHTPAEAVQAVLDGRADLVAAALTRNIPQKDALHFTRAVDRAAPLLVFRMGNTRPRTPAELEGRLLVSEGAGHSSRMEMLTAASPALKAGLTSEYDAEDLLYQVASGELTYTIASSALVAIHERYYPQIRTAFEVGEPEDVVLALAGGPDTSLLDASEAYLAGLGSRELSRLHDRYYGHVEELDYFSAVQVANHLRSRLPSLKPYFVAAGARHDIDWRLLAAIGYQESHWNPLATSYTGVRGIMMLTSDTALRYKVANREDPAQSIEGGARVLADLIDKVPAEVPEPDRTWMALAAYNQGLGHLLDARELTTTRGGDNLHWVDVRDTYPLLSRPRWAAKLKYGFARGREAVDFVSNVRAYFDIITMLTSGVRTLPPPPLRLDPQLRTASRDEPLVEEPMPAPPPELGEPQNLLPIPAERPLELAPETKPGLKLDPNMAGSPPTASKEPAEPQDAAGHTAN